ncbi:HEAT repeat domain-containing protein [Microbacterium bovistercoris]|uniref:HEAT repeat domain-containing protein n=1 Tax=Microbacterium bovistercoris TaxID=2293570 RepID=UPI0015F28993|nr:HEAT repeat domain-containing protein [Microbacterium bovistercoris]
MPVLLSYLTPRTDLKTLEEVIRALSVSWAKPDAVAPMISMFRNVDDPKELGVRWTVGNALDVLWDDSHFDELAELAMDRSYGRAREMLVLGMRRSKDPRAADILVGLLDDPSVNGHAVEALQKLAVPQARKGLEGMLGDERAWVRRSARRALEKLDRRGADTA